MTPPTTASSMATSTMRLFRTENSPGLMTGSSERVAQVSHLHPLAQERHPRHGDAVARMEPLRDFELAARRLANLHRAARDGLIRADDPRHLRPGGVLEHGGERHEDAAVQDAGAAVGEGDPRRHAWEHIHA